MTPDYAKQISLDPEMVRRFLEDPSNSQALVDAFYWHKTDEGATFWQETYREVRRGRELSPRAERALNGMLT